jgi:hypothetical protein
MRVTTTSENSAAKTLRENLAQENLFRRTPRK